MTDIDKLMADLELPDEQRRGLSTLINAVLDELPAQAGPFDAALRERFEAVAGRLARD